MRLTDRGVIKAGMWADIVVFDPATIRDFATFEKPNQTIEGMDTYWSTACQSSIRARRREKCPGKVLRGAGYSQ